MDVHDEPMKEAGAVLVGLASELANVVMATQSLQLRLIGLKPDKDAPLTPDTPDPDPTAALDPRAGQTAARFAWQPALDEEWLASASPVETARVWAAALPFADHDPTAVEALARAEARLEEIHPEAMSHYRQLRAGGSDAADAMLASAPIFDQPTVAGDLSAASAVVPAHLEPRPAPETIDLGKDVGLDSSLGVGADAAQSHVLERPEHSSTLSSESPSARASKARTPDLFSTGDEPSVGTFGEASEAPHLDTAPEAAPSLMPETPGASEHTPPGIDEGELSAEASEYLAYADRLHEAIATSPEPEATKAAELVMRNFPTANEAVDRMPTPRPKATSPSPTKKLAKRLGRH
jgi:hypothetical protein